MEVMVLAARSGLPGLISKYGIGWWMLIPAALVIALTVWTVRKDDREARTQQLPSEDEAR